MKRSRNAEHVEVVRPDQQAVRQEIEGGSHPRDRPRIQLSHAVPTGDRSTESYATC